MDRKERKANLLLLAAVPVIAAAGLLAVGPLRAVLAQPDRPVSAVQERALESESLPEGAGCTIEIRCDGLTDAMLPEGKTAPEDGCLLSARTVALEDGDTAFDVLRRVCETAGLALECSFTPLYGSYYVEGIGNLYEFDGGATSGWVFSVNGGEPAKSSSAVTLADGDTVVWRYSLAPGQ